MRRTTLSTLLTAAVTAAAVLIAGGAASSAATSEHAAVVDASHQRAAGTFSWNGTWRTSLWGDTVFTYTPPIQQGADDPIVSGSWGTQPSIQPNVPYGSATMRVRDRAFGDWRELTYAGGTSTPTETRRGRIAITPASGGKTLTGEYTVAPDAALRTDFTATCIAGECLGNTASPAEIENGTTPTNSGGAVVPATGKIKGAGVVKKGSAPTYKFRALRGVKATFQCKVDTKPWRTCASPYVLKSKSLRVGKHTLRVRALYKGKRDKTPSKKVVTVRR